MPFKSAFYNTLEAIARSNSCKWGFIIYRTTYDDQTAWDNYLSHMKAVAI